LAFIKGIEHFLDDGARREKSDGVGVGYVHQFGHDLLDLRHDVRLQVANFLSGC
jgi:hypothetical protein